MQLRESSKNILGQLKSLIEEIDEIGYKETLDLFSGASIGQHIRHILEFYQCLFESSDVISYDNRKRSIDIETKPLVALQIIQTLSSHLEGSWEDKEMVLISKLGNSGNINTIETPTFYSREHLYVVEHAVHHMAIIKIGVITRFPAIKLPSQFGVADSTLQYKAGQQCAQ